MLLIAIVISILQIAQPSLNPSGAWRLNQGLSEDVLEAHDISLAPWLKAPQTIVLRLADGVVTFYDQDGLRRIYRLGASTTLTESRGDHVGARANWDGATLRIEHQVARRREVVEAFRVDPGTHQLTVTVVVREGGVTTLDWIRHVYDPVR
jgi:hypothetical protein